MARLIHRAAALVAILLLATVALPALAAKTVLNVGMAAIDAGRDGCMLAARIRHWEGFS